MNKLIIAILLTINTYGANTSNFSKDEQLSIRTIVNNSKLNNKKNIKKLFNYLKINEEMAENMFVRMELQTVLYLCKRDNKCKIKKDKIKFLQMANNLDRLHLLNKNKINTLYSAFENLNKIMNSSNTARKSNKLTKKYKVNNKVDPMILRKQEYERLLTKQKNEKIRKQKYYKKKKIAKDKKEQERKNKILNNLNKMAKKKGYKGYQAGLEDLFTRLKIGATKLQFEKDYLWGFASSDDFIMESIVDNYVIYALRNNLNIKVGLLKNKNKFYQKGAYLDTDMYFSLYGVQEFKTILGTTIQVLIIKEVKHTY